jgi:hypothetical protein
MSRILTDYNAIGETDTYAGTCDVDVLVDIKFSAWHHAAADLDREAGRRGGGQRLGAVQATKWLCECGLQAARPKGRAKERRAVPRLAVASLCVSRNRRLPKGADLRASVAIRGGVLSLV